MSASDYGDSRWGVVEAGEVRYLMADRVEFTASGGVVFWGHSRGRGADKALDTFVVAAYAHGQWLRVFAASVLDGAPIAED